MSLLALSMAAGPLLSGCDALGDDVAARVDGREITIEQVRALADALEDGGGSVDGGRLDGDQARRALTGLVQLAVARSALQTLGEEVTAADTAVADQQVQSFSSAPQWIRDLLHSGFEATAALDRVITSHWGTTLGVATLDEIHRRAAERPDEVCVEGWVGPAANEDEAFALIDGSDGEPDDGLVELQFSPLGGTSPQFCHPADQLEQLPGGLGDDFDSEASDEFEAVQYEDPQAGAASVIFRPLGRQVTPDRDSDEFMTFAEQTVAAVLQQGGGLTAQVAMQLADVDIDSRFGSGFDERYVIQAPAAPLIPVSFPELPVPTGG